MVQKCSPLNCLQLSHKGSKEYWELNLRIIEDARDIKSAYDPALDCVLNEPCVWTAVALSEG